MDTDLNDRLENMGAALRVRESELHHVEEKLAKANEQILHLLSMLNSPVISRGISQCKFIVKGEKVRMYAA